MEIITRNYAFITVISIMMFVLFAFHSAFAEKSLPTNEPGNAYVELLDQDPTLSTEENRIEEKETIDVKGAKNICENRDNNTLTGKIVQMLPYEIVTGDYFGMFAKYFGYVAC